MRKTGLQPEGSVLSLDSCHDTEAPKQKLLYPAGLKQQPEASLGKGNIGFLSPFRALQPCWFIQIAPVELNSFRPVSGSKAWEGGLDFVAASIITPTLLEPDPPSSLPSPT